jgi:hypothetical protein
MAAERGFRLLRHDRYLSPNQARNIALPLVRTPFVVFMDNDLLVTPGWLEALLECAEETGAWAVGPLYFEGDPADEIIHMAGGDMALTGEPGVRQVTTTHRLQHVRFQEAPTLRREACDYLEFHCILLRTDVLEKLGPFDEGYLATREHLDLCLKIREGGGEIWFEPAARVTYLSPPPVPLSDIPYFWLRWSDAWSRASLEHFCEAYGVDPSYVERVSIMQRRRLAAFAPIRRVTRRVLGARADDLVGKVLTRAEPRLNRLVVATVGRAAGPSR